MGSLRMVMAHKLTHEVSEVALAHHQEMVEALLLQRLDEPLDERVEVGRMGQRFLTPMPDDFRISSNSRVNFVSWSSIRISGGSSASSPASIEKFLAC